VMMFKIAGAIINPVNHRFTLDVVHSWLMSVAYQTRTTCPG
jgi:hypothetical protein